MSRVIVELPLDRGFCGRLSAFDESGRLVCGPFAVAARAGDVRARAQSNPQRNPLLRYGDTPTGSYRVTGVAQHEARAQQEFGPHGVLVIEAVAGDAALAEANGRYRLFIQGGQPAPDGALRSTSGSLRLSNADLATLIAVLGQEKNLRVDIIAHEGTPQGNAVFVDNSVDDEDPPQVPGASSGLRDLFGEVSRRDALRAGAGGAAGLTALSLAVSFVSFGTQARAEVYTRMAYNDQPATEASGGGGETTGGSEAASGGEAAGGSEGGGAAPASSALDQLKNATSGNQTTGQTFDNGNGPSDATPTANIQEPPTPTASPVPQPESAQPETPPPEPSPPAEQEPQAPTPPPEPSEPPQEASSPPEEPSSTSQSSSESSESNPSSSTAPSYSAPSYSAPSYSAPEPSAPPPSRRSTTVIDIFPAGPTPQPGQKPPGSS